MNSDNKSAIATTATTATAATAGKKIIVIPATMSLHPERDGVKPLYNKKRVAAYCRVSTALEEQQGSYNLQQRYYETLIKANPAWELAGIYGDEGKSGTSLKGRTGFLEMIDDARAGKIDCIITKATSRFGRNNSQFIAILDELDSYGVEVLFESEGIVTSSYQDRTMLQMMGIANEHYSSTLSSNVRWSKERNMRSGKVTICYKTFLGYRKGADGNPEVVEEEAKIVRLIFELFLTGKPYSYIAHYLTEQGIPTPGGKDTWQGANIKRILTNEKYTGDVLLQKTYKKSYVDKKAYKNNGEKPQVLIKNNHEAIIDRATFARAQELVNKRKDQRNSGTSKDSFVGRVICADCGGYFGHKSWTSRGRIKYCMWVCNNKYTDETSFTDDKCKTANLRQEWLEEGYLVAINQLLARRSQIQGKCEWKLSRIETKLSSGAIDKEIKRLEKENLQLDEQSAELKVEWEFTFGDNSSYDAKMNELKQQKAANLQQKKALEEEKQQLGSDKKTIQTFMHTIEALPEKIVKFSGKSFLETIDHVEVSQTTLSYHFYGGECVKVKINDMKEAMKRR